MTKRRWRWPQWAILLLYLFAVVMNCSTLLNPAEQHPQARTAFAFEIVGNSLVLIMLWLGGFWK